MKALDREILRLAVPSILANITVPLVGMVDIAVAGHLHAADGSSAAFIGGISVGAMILNVLYWNFAFLRAGTGGLTAQAFGRANAGSRPHGTAPDECSSILRRALALSLCFAALLLCLQWPLSKLTLFFSDSTPRVAELAARYFFVRIWAAPATLSLMSLRGWFIGMQDTFSSMCTDLVVNVVNIAASIVLTLGLGSWNGLGFDGIALGTVVAQYCGLAFSAGVCLLKYRVPLRGGSVSSHGPGDFFHMNADLFVRSLCFTGVYLGYTFFASRQGETLLACANIMMTLLMLFSYFTDGFAYAGEALVGRFIGEADPVMTRRSTRAVFAWSMGVAGIWMLIYLLAGSPMLRMMTDDETVRNACSRFLPWLVAMPPLGCAAFTWDGIFTGATASRSMRNAMLLSMLAFFLVWFCGQLQPVPSGPAAIHLLMAAYFAHIVARTVHLSARYRKDIAKNDYLCTNK